MKHISLNTLMLALALAAVIIGVGCSIALRNELLRTPRDSVVIAKEFERWGMEPPNDDECNELITDARAEVKRLADILRSTDD